MTTNNSSVVHAQPRSTWLSTRATAEQEALVNVVRARLGHRNKSQTVAYAIDRLLEEHGLLPVEKETEAA